MYLSLKPSLHPPTNPNPLNTVAKTFTLVVYSLLWSFTGDAKLSVRNELGEFLRSCSTIHMPSGSTPLIDYEVFSISATCVSPTNTHGFKSYKMVNHS